MYWHDMTHGWWMIPMWLVVVVAAGFALRPLLGGRGDSLAELDSPEQIVRYRYARGEIDVEEMHQRLNELHAAHR